MWRFLRRILMLIIGSGLLAGILYLNSASFSAKWRTFVMQELASHGLHLDFDRLSLNPFGGVVARNVQIFNDEDRKQLLAAVDKITLSFDSGKVLNGKFQVETLELQNANLALPVDPEHPELTVVAVRDLNARAYLTDGHLEVRRADGELAGIRVSITGDMEVAPASKAPAAKKSAEEAASRRLEFVRENRRQIQIGLDWLARFKSARTPQLSVNFTGDSRRLQDLHANLSFAAQGLEYGGYTCDEFRIEAEYRAGYVDVKQFNVRDRLGSLSASAAWTSGADEARFHLTSTADLPSLASAFFNSDALKEVVFYDEPPQVSIDGTWYVRGPKANSPRPMRLLGHLQFGKFHSRGELFDGMSCQFGIDPEGFYVREGLLRHKTGTMALQVLNHPDQGFKYRAVLKMDPNVFLPFVQQQSTRVLIQKLQMNEGSSLFLRCEGSGPAPNLGLCENRGHAEARSIRFNGIEIESIETDLEFHGKQLKFTQAHLERPDGPAGAKEVFVDTAENYVRLTGAHAECEPTAIVRCFAPKTAEFISRYRLPSSTITDVNGSIGWKSPERTDCAITFSTTEGTGTYRLWGKDYLISRPQGALALKGAQLGLKITGTAFEYPLDVQGTVGLGPEVGNYEVVVKAGKFPYDVFDHTLPFMGLVANVGAKNDLVHFDVNATVLKGKASMEGTVDLHREPATYQGEVRINAVNFTEFARVYSPGNETEGDVTGHLKFTGVMDDWQKLKGGGVGIIVNANLYAVPILGPLTPLLGAFLPTPIKGYNVAKEANCTFQVADGFIVTEDFEALTSAFRLVLNGKVDFLNDRINFDAQARMRGLPGIVLRPFSELLQYEAAGSVGDPKWTPRLLNLVGSDEDKMRKAPDAKTLQEATDIAGPGGKPAVAPVEPTRKPRTNPLFRPGSR